jgi:hypothetical protein
LAEAALVRFIGPRIVNYDKYQPIMSNAWAHTFEMIETARYLRSLETMPYEDYLQTSEWQERAAAVKMLRGNRCEKCGSRDNLHAHHLTYENRGHEPLSDLQVLCKDCHAQEHGRAARAV